MPDGEDRIEADPLNPAFKPSTRQDIKADPALEPLLKKIEENGGWGITK